MFRKKAIDRLVDMYGGLSQTSRALAKHGVYASRQLLYAWRKQGYMPARYALKVHEMTRGEVSAQEIIEDYNELTSVKTVGV